MILTPGNSLAPKLKWIHSLKRSVEFRGSCLKHDKATFTNRNVINLFIFYELDTWLRDLYTNFTQGDCFFGW